MPATIFYSSPLSQTIQHRLTFLQSNATSRLINIWNFPSTPGQKSWPRLRRLCGITRTNSLFRHTRGTDNYYSFCSTSRFIFPTYLTGNAVFLRPATGSEIAANHTLFQQVVLPPEWPKYVKLFRGLKFLWWIEVRLSEGIGKFNVCNKFVTFEIEMMSA